MPFITQLGGTWSQLITAIMFFWCYFVIFCYLCSVLQTVDKWSLFSMLIRWGLKTARVGFAVKCNTLKNVAVFAPKYLPGGSYDSSPFGSRWNGTWASFPDFILLFSSSIDTKSIRGCKWDWTSPQLPHATAWWQHCQNAHDKQTESLFLAVSWPFLLASSQITFLQHCGFHTALCKHFEQPLAPPQTFLVFWSCFKATLSNSAQRIN